MPTLVKAALYHGDLGDISIKDYCIENVFYSVV